MTPKETPKQMIDWLIEKGETTYSLADKIGVNQSNVSRMQRSETTRPHKATLAGLTTYYKRMKRLKK